jgi:hypothetical protein
MTEMLKFLRKENSSYNHISEVYLEPANRNGDRRERGRVGAWRMEGRGLGGWRVGGLEDGG